MASEITVQTIRGPASGANANKILIPAGQTLDASSGFIPPPGGVLQVVQTVKTDTFSTQSTSYVDITGLTVTITPSSASNKILVLTNISINSQNAHGGGMLLLRNGTPINQADAAGNRRRSSFSGQGFTGDASGDQIMSMVVVGTYIDSPSSTSAVIYKVQVVNNTTEIQSINFGKDDADTNDRVRMVSSITVMEIAG